MILCATSVLWSGISNVSYFDHYIPERANTCAMELTIRLQWVMLLEMRHLWGMIASSQVTSVGLYTLQGIYGIITYSETFEYYIKQTKCLNINKNLIYYSVKDIWEIKIETPGKKCVKTQWL